MDSIPSQSPPLHHPLSLNSKSKLPIKRKSQNPSFDPNPNSPLKPPAFKFHRIWTQSDEIRFLQGLLQSSSDGLLFPRDLHLFFHRFSAATSHSFTFSQLTDKLRRLRKKFRAVSSRRNLHTLSLHDRAIFDLSNKLWGPDFASSSPFGSANPNRDRNDPSRHLASRDDPKMGIVFRDGEISGVGSKIVLDVFGECLEETKVGLFRQRVLCSEQKSCSQRVENFRIRWQEQVALELDVFARRLRLVIEDSLNHH